MSERRPELRIGDRERDAVASALQDAMAEGRLTMEEMQERLDAALQARTYADLDALVADLPIDPPSAALTSPRTSDPRLLRAPGSSVEDRLVLDAGWSSVTREGRWEIPPFVRVNGAVGSVRLDCLQATARSDVIDIEVIGNAGSITIVVPQDWSANLDRLSAGWGSAKSKVAAQPSRGAPLLVLHGAMGWGSLVVRHANWFDRRRLRKQGILLDPPRRPELGR
ncbi:DUF1707 SHOCT-like domain-containing protein [Desertihabitans aurantiacus]|uniref:DUF1707 SHOCT-like domain-containing protein n=1 Tax=Desertihabitans aurantiacus TaxID=2282477 RepID=UPI000DF85FB4|nr:DUF1707 domain-containing protein [Desertihabitans aurantiacus]